ncbi:MAG: pyridoxal phosphate-dependent aminotransferase [Thermoproteota archaeon]
MRTAMRIDRLVEPLHRRILKEASSMGGRIMNLSVGDIFIEPHPLVKEAVHKACGKAGLNYPPVEGLRELRESIAEYLRRTRGLEVDFENILVTAGASEAFLVALMTVLDIGNRLFLPDPTYPQHFLAASLFDCATVNYYRQDVEISKQAYEKMVGWNDIVLICSPNNPTGRVICAKDMEQLVEYVTENKSIIISDETYFEIFFNGNKPVSPGCFDVNLKNTIIISSFSKNMGITGLRVGFIASDKEVIKKAGTIRYATSLTSNSVGQQIVIQTLPMIDEISSYVKSQIERRLRNFMSGFKRTDLMKIYAPHGSLYVFPEIPFKSFDFCLQLTRETGVVLAPGQGFGPSGENHVRISFGAREEDIRDSIELINRFEPKLEQPVQGE